MIVEISIGLASCLVLTLVVCSRNEVRGWFLVRWLMAILSLRYRQEQRLSKHHSCRKYRGIREKWTDRYCPARIHHIDQLEHAQEIGVTTEASDDVFFHMTNTSGDWFSVGLRRSKDSAILLNIGLNEHGLFQHPHHPSGRISAKSDSFEAGDLRIELLEPRRRWRLAYNGWLRKGLLNPAAEVHFDETTGEFVHVKFYFIWEAYNDQFDKDLDVDAIARTQAYGIKGIDKLTLASSRTDQYGEMHGHVWIDGEKQHMHMRGAKLREYVPDPATLGVGRNTTVNSVMHYVTLETGVCMTLGLVRDERMGSNSSLCYGYVMMPIGGWTTVSYTNLTLADFQLHSMPMEYSFNFHTAGSKYEVHVTCHTSVTVQSGCDMTCTRPFTVLVNSWKGTGILHVQQRISHTEPNASLERPRPNYLRQTSAPLTVDAAILPFTAPSCRSTELVGGKGSSLAQLTQAGDMVTVPPGFCITVSAYGRHLSENLQLSQTITNMIQESADNLEKACLAIATAFRATSIGAQLLVEILEAMTATFGAGWETGKRLAVRSSAVGEDGSDMSCAGQMDTYLGVKGQAQLLESIVKCWSSQYSYQAVQYRRQHGQCMRTSMCVVVQEMVSADISGVMFTRDPISGNPGRVAINASYGLGEAIVSGVSEPDTMILTRSPAGDVSVRSRVLGTKLISMEMNDDGGVVPHERTEGDDSCCITDQMALKLGRIGVDLERYYGDARDVEWAVHDDVIYILQARPITSFDTYTDEECMEEFDSPIATDRVWLTTGNVGEMSPGALTPLSLSVFLPACEQLLSSLGPRKEQCLSYDTRAYVGRNSVSTANNLFLNLFSLYQVTENHVLWTSRKGAEMAVVGHVVREITNEEVLEYTGASPWWRRAYNFYLNFKARGSARGKTKEWEEKLEAYSISGDSAKDLYSEIDTKLPDYIEVWLDAGMCTSRSGVASNALVGVVARNDSDWRPEHFSDVAMILEKCDNVYSADVPAAIRLLSEAIRQSGEAERFIKMDDKAAVSWLEAPSGGEVHELYSRFMARHGHRCVREAEFREASWRTEPTKIIPSVKMMLRTTGVVTKERAKRTPDEIIAKLKTPLNFTQRMILRRLIPWARKAVGEREWGKSVSICMCDKFKQAYWRLGHLMTSEGYLPDPDLLFFLTHYEIGKLLDQRPPNLITKALKRRRMLPRMADVSYPLLSTGHPQPNPRYQSLPIEGDICLTGTPVSQGVIRGVARVVKSLPEANAIQEGDILLVPYTDVGWTPYFPLISGLVTEIGSILSHGAVVAREYGLPCIVNCKGATDVFASGDRVLLDASQGLLTRIPEEE